MASYVHALRRSASRSPHASFGLVGQNVIPHNKALRIQHPVLTAPVFPLKTCFNLTYSQYPVRSLSGPSSSKTPSARSSAVFSSPQSSPPKPILDFQNTAEAYKSKTTAELIHALVIFSLCTIKPLVDNSEMLLRLIRRTLGDKVAETLIRPTFFKYFCAGEDGESIRPKVTQLRSYNVGGILDYAAEADLAEEDEAKGKVPVSSQSSVNDQECGRYGSEELKCDANVRLFRSCITAVHNVTPEGFAAIKLTALSNPILIERLSSMIVALRALFYAGFAATIPSPAQRATYTNQHRAADPNVDLESPAYVVTAVDDGRVITQDQFTEGLKNCFDGMTDDEIAALFNRMDVDKNGSIDVFEWTCTLPMDELINLASRARPGTALYHCRLDESDISALQRLKARLDELATLATRMDVRLMIDAEQTYFQPAIDLLVLELQRVYNAKKAIVWGTYQCYLKDSYRRLTDDLHRAKNEGFLWGAKLVRGAYMTQETQRAKEKGYDNPIWPNIQATHENYNRSLAYVLGKLHRASVLVASHNQVSAEFATAEMKRRGIDPAKGGVYFGQLLGMADHLTFTLGQAGYKAYKYVPYGPVLEVLPYLIRRAQENSNIMGGVGIEKKLIWKELLRRKFMPQSRIPLDTSTTASSPVSSLPSEKDIRKINNDSSNQ